MTEKTDQLELSPVVRKFILHWGEMGSRWGINRTVAQIHALLYVVPRPLSAEQIAQVLSVARSNVSTSLKELQAWGVVRVVHELGDRRDRFETMADVWEMFQVVLAERKKREVDPTVALLKECLAEARQEKPADAGQAYARRRMADMLEFFQSVNDGYEQLRGLSPHAMLRLARMGSKVKKLLGLAS